MIRFLTTLSLCLLFSFSAVAQQKKPVKLPYKDGKIVYSFEHVFKKKKKKQLFQKTLKWIERDSLLKITKADEKTGEIQIESIYLISTKRYLNEVDYRLDFVIEKNKVSYELYGFYLSEIDLTIAEFLKKNKDSKGETVQESIWYLTSGLHGKVYTFYHLLKSHLEE